MAPNYSSDLDAKEAPRRRAVRTPTTVRRLNADVMAEPPVTAMTISPERPFMSLPLHVVADILSSLGEVEHLPNVLLAHPIFYAAYKDFPTLAHGALRKQIPDDEIYVLALISYESDPARRSKRDLSSTSFLASYRDDPVKLIGHHGYIRLYESLRLGEFHNSVIKLRDSFIDRTLRRLYGITDVHRELPADIKRLSALESRRIERALYRFQIYCNLFSSSFRTGQDEAEAKRTFYDKHPTWVNEQLGCVHDFLESELQLAIDQVALRSAERAEWLLDGSKGKKKQHFLSLGLSWLHHLFNTTSPEEQFNLLYAAKDFEGSNDEIAPAVLATPAVELNQNLNDQNMRGPTADWIQKVRTVFTDKDSENGPEHLWKEIHSLGRSGTSIIVDQAFALRRLGYVLWDRKRTDESVCRESIRAARADLSPTFFSSSRFMNPAHAWDPQFRLKQPSRPAVETGRRQGGGGARAFVRRPGAARPTAHVNQSSVVRPTEPTPATKAANKARMEQELRPRIQETLRAVQPSDVPVIPVNEAPILAARTHAVPGSSRAVGPAPGPSAGTAAKVPAA